MAAATRYLELTLLSERFAISRLDAGSSIPTWATQGPFFSMTRTGDELSIVSELSRVPVGVQSQPGWRVLKVHGPFVLSEIGVLAALATPLAEEKVLGEVTHSLSILRDGTAKIVFDSAGLTIQKVTVNKAPAKFETTPEKLIIPLSAEAKTGDKFEITIRYDGEPTKGMYFILPDKDYPDRPSQIWTQGESEDTHYYLPTYDYPNDRLTTETILTVPASWITLSNGKLLNVTDAGKGLKTWYWKDSVPSSTYLITLVADQFRQMKDTWRGIPVTYYAPKGRADRLAINFGRTPAMIELFSKKFGVDYAWEKYAQVMVDDFVAGGMENSSATTNTRNSLVHPKLAPEYLTGEDDLISHELG